jgi:ribosomal protection tetracycline resistance protein
MQSLNLGILAHVDAGKTSLTERLLYAAGSISQLGSVDEGNTQTDTLALERQRGITIKSAVASFPISSDLTVNLIDTPGHPDFIAEVERILRVLDGAVLVISAVEGVQPQTRILMRALRRLHIPSLLFVNKIDRVGAREGALLEEIGQTLGLTVIPMGFTTHLGSKAADFTPWSERNGQRSEIVEGLAEHDEDILNRYIEGDGELSPDQLHQELKSQTQHALIHPAFFGSARTGAGIDSLLLGIADLLPAGHPGDPHAPTRGTVFKIERGVAREKIAYVRLFSGALRVRDRLVYGKDHEGKVTAIEVSNCPSGDADSVVTAGNIAKVWGLHDVQIGDRVGQFGTDEVDQQFALPTMEAVIEANDVADGARLRTALTELTEQDPLISVRQDEDLNEITVSLYGEVQREVIQSTLANDYHIDAEFREATTIYIERLVGIGEAVEFLTSDTNPYMATIGLRVEAGQVPSGVKFSLDVDHRSLPMFIYKTEEGFIDHMMKYIRRSLRRGLFGWEVTDCIVTMTGCGYYTSDGPAKPTVPMARATSADFRKLTPRVVQKALERAGTQVCEPMVRLNVESPSDTIGDVLQAIAQLGGSIAQTKVRGTISNVEARLPADRSRDLQRQLVGLTSGQGNLEADFDGYRPVPGRPPERSSISRRTAP